MKYFIFFRDDQNVPKTGLTPSWSSLRAADGTDKSGDAPAISEVGGGWYSFDLHYGDAPFDVAELVGVIDAGAGVGVKLNRYQPVRMSLRDLAPVRQVNLALHDLETGVTTYRNDDDDGNELVLTLTQSENVETRTPSGE